MGQFEPILGPFGPTPCSERSYISDCPSALHNATGTALKTIFAVLGVSTPDALAPIIQKAYPADNFEVGMGQWLVADAGTSQDVAAKLGITAEGSPSTAVVVTVGGYFGRYAAPLWEWMKAKQSSNG